MSITEEIKASIGQQWSEFETLLRQTLQSQSIILNRINTYLLAASGKQLRPLLALVTAKACSGLVNEKAVACATVSELIHTATLLHDDVVDDSDMRRGRETVKKIFSPGASLLIGDFWLTRAIHLLISHDCPNRVISVYSKTLEELAEGEMMQMDFSDNLLTTEKDYIAIIKRKTASLFIASILGPAIVSGASKDEVDALEQYAYNLGCCFQIRDDILDYFPASVTGKDSNSDLLERKITMPLLCAMSACPEKEDYIRQVLGRITMTQENKEADMAAAEEVRNFVIEHGGIELAKVKLKEYLAEAKRYLAVLRPSDSRDKLEAIADYIGEL